MSLLPQLPPGLPRRYREMLAKAMEPAPIPPKEPWLRHEAWRNREIVWSGQGVTLRALVLAYLAFGPIALLGFWVTIDEGQFGPGLGLAGAAVFVLSGLTYWWWRDLRYGPCVCRLLTLPGVVGGWFKADVECMLPPDPAEPVIVRLKNLVGEGKYAKQVWQMEQELLVPVAAGKLSVVPVRLRVPRDPAQQPPPLEESVTLQYLLHGKRWWMLVLEKKADGVDFHARFHVPIYDTTDAPASEQREEPPAPVAPYHDGTRANPFGETKPNEPVVAPAALFVGAIGTVLAGIGAAEQFADPSVPVPLRFEGYQFVLMGAGALLAMVPFAQIIKKARQGTGTRS